MDKLANEILFETLLTDPEKRAQVFELLTQEGLVGNNERSTPKKILSTFKQLHDKNIHSPKSSRYKQQNIKLESPSALGRRRALQRLESDSSNEDSVKKLPSPPFAGTPVPFDRLLKGVVAYCEVNSNGEDRSSSVKSMMRAMGAKVKEIFDTDVTHLIFKDGLYSTFRKAKLLKIHVVSVLWLEAVRKHKFRVPESKYPTFGSEASNADVLKICQNIQSDYDTVIQDEYQKKEEYERRISETPKNYVTERRKTSRKPNMSILAQKEPHNRTEIATPYKYRCNSPVLSESDSYISVGSNSNKSVDLIPSSQRTPELLLKSNEKLPKVSEEINEESPKNNLGKLTKDSFELEGVSKIKSPKNVNNNRTSDSSKKLSEDTDDVSFKLRISTTDESNINTTNIERHTLSNLSQNIEVLNSTSKSNLSNSLKNKRRMTIGLKAPPKKLKENKDDTASQDETKNSLKSNTSSRESIDIKINKKQRRKTVCNSTQENISTTKETEAKVTSSESGEKPKIKRVKLFNPNQVIEDLLINWDEDGPKKADVSLPKKNTYEITQFTKLLSSKAQEKVTKNKEKKIGKVLKFSSTSSEASDVEAPKKNPPVLTPSRRSVRIIEKNHTVVDNVERTPKVANKRPLSKDSESEKKIAKTPKSRKEVLINEEVSTPSRNTRRSTLDFVAPKPRKSMDVKSQKSKESTKICSIVCTRLHRSDVQVFQQIVKKIGGFVIEDEVSKRTTHLVSGDSSRTVNMLRAIARGCWILRQEWLFKSLEAGKWLEEEDYEMVEFSPAVQKCRLEKQSFGHLYSMDIFKDCGEIFISRGSTPRFSDLEELVQLCNGNLVRTAQEAKIVVGEYIDNEKLICVNEKWILDSITFNKKKKFRGYLITNK